MAALCFGPRTETLASRTTYPRALLASSLLESKAVRLISDTIGDLAVKLDSLLKLRSIPFDMKAFRTSRRYGCDPKIRRPKSVHTLDQVIAPAARLGWIVGITAEEAPLRRAFEGVRNSTWRRGPLLRHC
jgi:hypothetical protein